MFDTVVILDSIAVNCALLAAALFIGRQRFVRETYAALLAGAFAAIAASYMFALGSVTLPRLAAPLLVADAAAFLGGLLLLVAGFRSRSRLAPFPAPVLAAGAALLIASLGAVFVPGWRWAFSPVLIVAATLAPLLCAAALRRGPEAGMSRGGPALWMFLSFSIFLTAQLGLTAASPWFDPRVRQFVAFLNLVGPSEGLTGIGLFAILLLVEDLSARLRRLASVDPLTGVLNRRGIEQAAEPLIAQARRTGRPLSLVVADLDRFKSVNDRFGHALGDQVLQRFAAHACGTVREGDLVGRLGGEEFVLVLAIADRVEVNVAIERMRVSLAAAFVDLELPVAITASYGIAAFHAGDTLATMLVRADRALYGAKADGRDRVAFAEREEPVVDPRFRAAWTHGGPAVTAGDERRVGRSVR